jgi:hypothetical protein
MPPRIPRGRLVGLPLACVGALAVLGCAARRPPSATLATADTAVREAVESDAAQHAPLELRLAREKLERATRAAEEEVGGAAGRAPDAAGGRRDGVTMKETRAMSRNTTRVTVGSLFGLAVLYALVACGRPRPDAALEHQRRVEIARAVAREKVAEQESERLAREREEVLLGARTGEARRAREQASQLADELAALRARETERGLEVALSDVNFDFNRAALHPLATRDLRRLVQYLKAN